MLKRKPDKPTSRRRSTFSSRRAIWLYNEILSQDQLLKPMTCDCCISLIEFTDLARGFSGKNGITCYVAAHPPKFIPEDHPALGDDRLMILQCNFEKEFVCGYVYGESEFLSIEPRDQHFAGLSIHVGKGKRASSLQNLEWVADYIADDYQ